MNMLLSIQCFCSFFCYTFLLFIYRKNFWVTQKQRFEQNGWQICWENRMFLGHVIWKRRTSAGGDTMESPTTGSSPLINNFSVSRHMHMVCVCAMNNCFWVQILGSCRHIRKDRTKE